jgi:membrane protein YqaA with SNARE-associated domain
MMDFIDWFRYESSMLRKLYDWIVALSARPSAPWALAAVAFAESSFFIIPPDVMLAPMALARPERAFRYAFVCTLGSVAGGMLGYAIGHLLFDSVGMWILDLYGYGAKVELVKEAYAKWGAMLILLKGLTPIPFKLVTIVSGGLDYNFPLFVLLSFITRGARFFLLAGLLNRFGGPMRNFIENRLGLVVSGMVALFVLGLIVAAKLA